MMALSAVISLWNAPIAEKPKQADQSFSTRLKVHCTALRIIGYLALAGTAASIALYLTYVITWQVSALFALLFLAGGAIALSKAKEESSIDPYSTPASLNQLREKARSQPLAQIVKEHGWEKLLRYAILSPQDFQKKYREQASGQKFDDVLATYEATVGHIGKVKQLLGSAAASFEVPSPQESATKWSDEFGKTDERTIADFMKRYRDIDKLVKYKAIPEHHKKVVEMLKKEVEGLQWDPCDDFLKVCEEKNQQLLARIKESDNESVEHLVRIELELIPIQITGIQKRIDAKIKEIWKILAHQRGKAAELDSAYRLLRDGFNSILRIPTGVYAEASGAKKSNTWHQKSHDLILAAERRLFSDLKRQLNEKKFDELKELVMKEHLARYKVQLSYGGLYA